MALYGIILFVIYGWVEFEAMAHVVDAIGGLLAFLGIFVTAIIGIHLLRTQSAIVMASFRADLAKGQMNSTAIASSLSLLIGAVLMLIPGYVTDGLGLLCFVPGLRAVIGAFVAKRFASRLRGGMAGGFPGGFSGGFSRGFSQDDASAPFGTADLPHPDFEDGTTKAPFADRHRRSARPKAHDEDIIEGEFKEKN